MACRARLMSQLVAVVVAAAALAAAQDQDCDDCLDMEVSLLQRGVSMVGLRAGGAQQSERAATSGLHDSATLEPTVLITGATGGTGRILYRMLKERNVTVRALVRSTSKAKEVLNCDKCDASEGIFVGDVTEEHCLDEAAKGITTLVNLVVARPICKVDSDCYFNHRPTCKGFYHNDCRYPEGGTPEQVNWEGGVNQLRSLIDANGDHPAHVVTLSISGTEIPENNADKLDKGWFAFYMLNFEAYLMATGLPFTIVKSCPLADEPGGERELRVSPRGSNYADIERPVNVRADAATMLMEAVLQPDLAANLRFNMCSRPGPPTTDYADLLRSGRGM